MEHLDGLGRPPIDIDATDDVPYRETLTYYAIFMDGPHGGTEDIFFNGLPVPDVYRFAPAPSFQVGPTTTPVFVTPITYRLSHIKPPHAFYRLEQTS